MRTLLAATCFTTLASLGLIASIGYVGLAEAKYGDSANGGSGDTTGSASDRSGKTPRQSAGTITFYTHGGGEDSAQKTGTGWGASMAGRGA